MEHSHLWINLVTGSLTLQLDSQPLPQSSLLLRYWSSSLELLLYRLEIKKRPLAPHRWCTLEVLQDLIWWTHQRECTQLEEARIRCLVSWPWSRRSQYACKFRLCKGVRPSTIHWTWCQRWEAAVWFYVWELCLASICMSIICMFIPTWLRHLWCQPNITWTS